MSTHSSLGLVLLVWVHAGGRVLAAEPPRADAATDEGPVIKAESAARAGASRGVDDSTAPKRPEVMPLPVGARPVEVVVTAGTGVTAPTPGTVAADAAERLVYRNTLGTFVNTLRANYLVADDLSLNAPPGCNLRRYSFQVSLKADPTGIGGPLTATFALYDTCPQAGGKPVPGTGGAVTFSGAWVDVTPLTNIVVLIPEGSAVALPSTVWLAVRFSRDNCGVVLGAPALVGFSDDVYDFPLLNCQATVGGFPRFPQASFNAEVYVDSTCPHAFLGYRNIAPGKPGHNFGTGVRYADDLELGVQTCDLIGYEIGVRGQAAYLVDLRRDAGNFPGSVIEGTQAQVLSLGNSIQLFSREIDPPIRLAGAPIRVWMAVRPNLSTGKWIRTGQNAQIGNTAPGVAKETSLGSGTWQIVFPDEPKVYEGYYATLICEGDPPLGGCCDMYVTQCKGGPDDGAPCGGWGGIACAEGGSCESVCRRVAEMNCAFRPGAVPLGPQWMEGAACDPDPFPHACGLAACCTPDDTCENLTWNDCYALEPVALMRQWQLGHYCDEGTQDCPFSACLQRQGECLLPHQPTGCWEPNCCASVCAADPFCCRVEWDRICVALADDGRCAGIQTPNDECAPTVRVQGATPLAIPSSTLALSERATLNGSADPGSCCNEDAPGSHALGTVWYRFTVPERTAPNQPERVSLQLDTCATSPPTAELDSLIEVFSIRDSDQGRCTGIGECHDGTICLVEANECADGSRCVPTSYPCSIEEAGGCPFGTECEFDLAAACDRSTSLAVIGCNDDAEDACGCPEAKAGLSKLCVPDLVRGQTYLALVGRSINAPASNFRLRLEEVDECPNLVGRPDNDYCYRAEPLPYSESEVRRVPFDLTNATWDCAPPDLTCPSMENDVWFEYTPELTGQVTFETCGPDNASTPNTCVAVYDGCQCPARGPANLGCSCLNLEDPQCQAGAKVVANVAGGDCYKVRVSDDRGGRGAADLIYTFTAADCNENEIPDTCDLSCGEVGSRCDVPNCGQHADCNENDLPDECDIPLEQGGFCDVALRNDCSDDLDGDGRPDECAVRAEAKARRPAADVRRQNSVSSVVAGPTGECCGVSGSCLLPHGEPGCENDFCCQDVCEVDSFCCLVEWDRACVVLATERCGWLRTENDVCSPVGGLEGATLVDVPGSAITPGWLAATDPSEPGFCCHQGPDRFCTGNYGDVPCFSDLDCPFSSCPPGGPQPGAHGYGTVWYKFVAAYTSAELTLEFSEFPVTRTLLRVFDVGDPTTPETACHSLTPIACLDAAAGGSHSGFDRTSALCVRDLVPGHLYYVAAAAKTRKDLGLYRLTIDAPCAPNRRLLNDTCGHATPLSGKVAFNLEDAIIECPTSDCGGPLQRDVWFDYVAQEDGTVELSACSLDLLPGQQPWTVIVREGCECDDESRPIVLCADMADELCRSNSSVSFEARAGQCYKIRLGARSISAPNGELCINCRYCPRATVRWDRPILGGFEDMRRPFDPQDPAALEGIALLGVEASEDADDACWSFCETSLNPKLHPQYPPGAEHNGISFIENVYNSEYVIHFKRPLTPGEQTSVTYTDDSGAVSRALFVVHPGEVNGDGVADGNDLLAFAEGLRKWCFGPRLCLDDRDYWPYIVDMNRDDQLTAQDLLELVDLLVGAGPYEPWLGSVVPFEAVECP